MAEKQKIKIGQRWKWTNRDDVSIVQLRSSKKTMLGDLDIKILATNEMLPVGSIQNWGFYNLMEN